MRQGCRMQRYMFVTKSLLMIVFLSLKGGKCSVLETAVSDQDCQ